MRTDFDDPSSDPSIHHAFFDPHPSYRDFPSNRRTRRSPERTAKKPNHRTNETIRRASTFRPARG